MKQFLGENYPATRPYRLMGVLLAFSLLAGTGCKEQVDTLVAGTLFNCATHGDEVTCWGIFGGFQAAGVEEQGWTFSQFAEYATHQFLLGQFNYASG